MRYRCFITYCGWGIFCNIQYNSMAWSFSLWMPISLSCWRLVRNPFSIKYGWISFVFKSLVSASIIGCKTSATLDTFSVKKWQITSQKLGGNWMYIWNMIVTHFEGTNLLDDPHKAWGMPLPMHARERPEGKPKGLLKAAIILCRYIHVEVDSV